MFSDMVNNMLKDWFGRIVLLCLGLTLAAFIALSCVLANSFYVNHVNKLAHGVIESKEYIEGHNTIILTGKVMVPYYVPDDYQIVITDGVKHYRVSIVKEQYEVLKLGDEYEVRE